jgi:sugar lactone lactonase YvrE
MRLNTHLMTLVVVAVPALAGAQVEFVAAWGGNVNTSGTTPDVCEKAAGCKAGSYSELDGHFKNPAGVAVDTKGNVYVADEYNHRIQKFDSNGDFKLAWGSKGGLGGQFLNPWGVAVDASGNVYVVGRKNHRVQKFDSGGNFKLAWGSNVDSSGTTPDVCEDAASCQAGSVGGLGGQFKDPRNVAVDASGTVYVADTQNSRIQKFDSSGNFKLAWGYRVDSSGTTPDICENATSCQAGSGSAQEGGFNWPESVGVDTNGNVYVADWGNSRIQKFDSSGNFKLAWGSKGGLGGQFINPNGVAVDSNGNVYVTGGSYRTKNQRVQKFDSSISFKLAWGGNVDTSGMTPDVCENAASCQAGTKGVLGGQFRDPTGVAVDTNGNVYVADRSNHRIQKFSIIAE